jgi:hypothetical protein
MIGFTNTFIYNHLQHLTIDERLRNAPFLTGLRVYSLLLWLTWLWFTNQPLLRMTYECTVCRLKYDWLNLSQSQSYVTTDGQSASLSWNKAPVWGSRPDFYYCQTVAGLFMWGALTRGRVCRSQLLLVLASAVIFGSESRGTRDHILLSQIRDFPFSRLLRLAGLRWRYSTAPPRGSAPVLVWTAAYIVSHWLTQSITCPPFITPGRTE